VCVYEYIPNSCWFQWSRSLRRGSAAACLLGLWVRIPPETWMCVLRLMCVVSATSRSLIQRSPTRCVCVSVTECGIKTLKKRLRPDLGCFAIKKFFVLNIIPGSVSGLFYGDVIWVSKKVSLLLQFFQALSEEQLGTHCHQETEGTAINFVKSVSMLVDALCKRTRLGSRAGDLKNVNYQFKSKNRVVRTLLKSVRNMLIHSSRSKV